MITIENHSRNPYYNLALEEFTFRHFPGEDIFILWINEPTVVVGKHQNTLQEINMPYIRENKIHVVRRITGGGAVYHDLGNLNYTIISEARASAGFDFEKFSQPIIQVLKKKGIEAEFSGRNDIQIDGQKICGNAQYREGNRILHHGCILFDVDFTALENALQVSEDKRMSKGIKSVRSRVTNIVNHIDEPYSIEDFNQDILDYMKETEKIRAYTLTEKDRAMIEELKEKRYDNWDWVFGKSPESNLERKRRFPAGSLEFYFELKKGRIKALQVRGDFFGSGEIQDFLTPFIGAPYEREMLNKIMDTLNVPYFFSGFTSEQVLTL